MAFTVSNVVRDTWGANKINILRVTADATTQTIDTGFNVVKHASLMNEGASTSPVMVMNAGAEGTSINGSIALSGCTAAAIYHLWVVSPA
jgi:hypothetical protein